MTSDEFWNHFLKETGKSANTTYLESFHFEMTEKLANELLNLVLIGQKKATASSQQYYERQDERIPQPGDYSIVTDWAGEPKCIIETKKVIIQPFQDITFELCSLEGEDDSLESWRAGHRAFFMAEGKELGYNFTEDMPVVFEVFEVVYSN